LCKNQKIIENKKNVPRKIKQKKRRQRQKTVQRKIKKRIGAKRP
jgi:hypothetical protein